MSHSDNLYSAEESDHESFSDELSPADGYFHRGDRPPNAMVPDPSLEDSKEPEAKTLIPPHLLESMGRGSRLSNPSASLPSRNYASAHSISSSVPSGSGSSYTPTSPVAARRLDDLFPRRPASINGPPPAYTPSPEPTFSPTQDRNQPSHASHASLPNLPILPSDPPSDPSPRSPPAQSSPVTYNTFPEQHLERGYLPRREEPESMGNPEEIPSESTPLSRRPRRQSPCRNFIRRLLFVGLVFAITTTVLTTIFGGHKSDSSHDKPPKDDMPPSPNRPIDSSGPYCISAIYREDLATYDVPLGANLTILQITHDGDDGDRTFTVRTAGEVRLRRIPKDSNRGRQAFITVDVHVSDPSLHVIKTWDHERKVLQVSTPKYARLVSSGPHCVSLEITAWFPEDAEFSNLLIESFDLTLRVIEDIKINVSGESKFATVLGQVAFPPTSPLGSITELHTLPDTISSTIVDGSSSSPAGKASASIPFSSRRILVETVSGSITGCYPLMDYLGMIAQAGSIKVIVNPQPVLPDAPAPAELEIQTASGSIEVNLPVRDALNSEYMPPPRNYISRVHSSAGSIKGSYYLGSTSDFRSMSGSIFIVTMPVLQAGSSDQSGLPPNLFATHTVAGSIQVEVLDPIFITMVPFDERPDRPTHPTPYIPIGDDDPYIIIPPSMDKALFKVDDPESLKRKPLRNLKSSHGSQSSSISVSYPRLWEGSFHAKSISGSIKWAGDGLRLIEDKKGYASHEVWLRKGVDSEKDGCIVEMSDIAGSLRFAVGTTI